MGLREKYEEFHELTITDEAIRAAVELSDRYISDRYLPDKAIDLMDEAASRIRVRSMTVPAHLQALDEEVRKVCEAKKKAAAAQEYEQAAVLREDVYKRQGLYETENITCGSYKTSDKSGRDFRQTSEGISGRRRN